MERQGHPLGGDPGHCHGVNLRFPCLYRSKCSHQPGSPWQGFQLQLSVAAVLLRHQSALYRILLPLVALHGHAGGDSQHPARCRMRNCAVHPRGVWAGGTATVQKLVDEQALLCVH